LQNAEHLITANHVNALSQFSKALLFSGLKKKNGSQIDEDSNDLFKIKTGYMSVIRHCIQFNGLFHINPSTDMNTYFKDPIVSQILAQLAFTLSSRMFNNYNRKSIMQIELPQEAVIILTMRTQLRNHFKYMKQVLHSKKSQNKVYSPVKVYQKATAAANISLAVEEKVRQQIMNSNLFNDDNQNNNEQDLLHLFGAVTQKSKQICEDTTDKLSSMSTMKMSSSNSSNSIIQSNIKAHKSYQIAENDDDYDDIVEQVNDAEDDDVDNDDEEEEEDDDDDKENAVNSKRKKPLAKQNKDKRFKMEKEILQRNLR